MVNHKVVIMCFFWCLFVVGCSKTNLSINNVDFSILKTHKIIIIGANWCGPCQKMKKDLNSNNIPYQYIEYDKNNDFIKSINIIGLPTYLLIDNNNNIVKVKTGYSSINDIILFLKIQT